MKKGTSDHLIGDPRMAFAILHQSKPIAEHTQNVTVHTDPPNEIQMCIIIKRLK